MCRYRNNVRAEQFGERFFGVFQSALVVRLETLSGRSRAHSCGRRAWSSASFVHVRGKALRPVH